MIPRIADIKESLDAISENREHVYERIPVPPSTLQCWTIRLKNPIPREPDLVEPIRIASSLALSEYFWTQYARVSFRRNADYVLQMCVTGQFGGGEQQHHELVPYIGKKYRLNITLLNERNEKRDIRFRIFFK